MNMHAISTQIGWKFILIIYIHSIEKFSIEIAHFLVFWIDAKV